MKISKQKKQYRGAVSERAKPSRTFDISRCYPALILLLVVAITAVCYQGVIKLTNKPVARVAINGDFRHIRKQSIIDEVTPYLEAGFVLLDLDGIRDKLIERPWVYDISVNRQWPDEIGITVVEQTPIARWGNNGLLNHRGNLFFPEQFDDFLFVDLPQLSGPEQSASQVMNHYRELSGMLNKQGLQIHQVRLGQRGNWVIGISDGRETNKIQMFLGASDVMLKMHRFVSVYELVLADKFEQVSRVDMRYNNGLAVQWDENSAT